MVSNYGLSLETTEMERLKKQPIQSGCEYKKTFMKNTNISSLINYNI
jgi:hypothetical protein